VAGEITAFAHVRFQRTGARTFPLPVKAADRE